MKYDNKKLAEHLSGMIQFQTVSKDDESQVDFIEFLKFHEYLELTYPLVHKHLTREIIGKAGLLFHWKGNGTSKNLPLMLIAHQDVVPVGDESAWKYPPFSGHLDDEGILWGRGTTDCKCIMLYELEAVEGLLADGFVPDMDVYLAYGYNEEIMESRPIAAGGMIVDELKKRGIQVGMVLDEGIGVVERNGQLIGDVYIGEKGYADHEFTIEGQGGHAAFPPAHNALGKLGYNMWLLEENPMESALHESTVITMKTQAEMLDISNKDILGNPEQNWEKIKELSNENPMIIPLIRTTTTPTMASASEQSNILPQRASIITNSRILPGQTLEDLEAHFKAILPEEVNFKLIKGHNPPEVSSIESFGYRLLSRVTEEINPGAKLIPSVVPGGTDSRWYGEICPTNSVYRYVGGKGSTKSGGAHGVNEHIDISQLSSNVEFYVKIIMNYGDAC